MIAKSVAGIAKFDFFISKIYNSKDVGRKFPGLNTLLFHMINRKIHHTRNLPPNVLKFYLLQWVQFTTINKI
ncbi:hypothetical protein DBR39_15865 [Chryseobacterium sp. KBW03]|nr:hypothetical protein DBR39_15865 [Chryseobacterium sp. KBW03]